MTKANRARKKLAEKRRRALASAGLPELAPIKRRDAQARKNGRFIKIEEDPTITALNARCARLGIPADEKGRSIAKGQHLCCDLGYVLEYCCKPDERARLWDVFHRWTRAEVTYRVRYIGQGGQPASAALMMVHDSIETDPSLIVDVRDDEQRDRDAVNGWMRWQGYLGHLDVPYREMLTFARVGYGPVLWWEGQPTPKGMIALRGLRLLADVTEQKRC